MGTLASFLCGMLIAIVFIVGYYEAAPDLSTNYWILFFLCAFGGLLGSIKFANNNLVNLLSGALATTFMTILYWVIT